jgi:Taurine catabolism dioxygenase TauD, TfdA family
MVEMLSEPISDASAWRGADLVKGERWLYYLEVGAADEVRRTVEVNLAGRRPSPAHAVEAIFRHALDRVLRGTGFAVIRGFPIEYSIDSLEELLRQLVSKFGSLINENAAGEKIVRVFDRGLTRSDPNARGYQTRLGLSFHSDPGGDVVGLFCVRKAPIGGQSAIVSSTTLHNDLLALHPEYLDSLYAGFIHDRRGEQRAGEAPISAKVPIFSYCRGDLSCRYTRFYIASGQEKAGSPLRADERAMFDYVDEWTRDPRNHLMFELEPGDLFLCNNHTTLHSRTSYVDWPDPERKRLVLRFWLAVPNARNLPIDLGYWYGPTCQGTQFYSTTRPE